MVGIRRLARHDSIGSRTLEREVAIEVGVLELEGVPPGRRFAVAAAFERELVRLIVERGLPDAPAFAPGAGRRSLSAAERVAPPAGVRADANPVLLGQSIALSVWEGLR